MRIDHIIAIVVCIIALLAIILWTGIEALIKGDGFNIYRMFYCPAIIVFTIAYICPHNSLNVLSIAVSIFLMIPVAVWGKRMDRYGY